jgi:hypothetical protein
METTPFPLFYGNHRTNNQEVPVKASEVREQSLNSVEQRAKSKKPEVRSRRST